MSRAVYIEVAVPQGTTNDKRGAVLERFAKRLLETQNFEVTDQIRLTGMEVDLLARDRDTGERILVECKAHRSTISAEVLAKLLGNVTFRRVESGWLISTYHLGKDAKGWQLDWEERPLEERKRIRVYDPSRLVSRLISAKLVVDPNILPSPPNSRASDDAYLLLTLSGEFWILPILDTQTGLRNSVSVFDAPTGRAVTSSDALRLLAETDASIADFIEIELQSARTTSQSLSIHAELQSIVHVPVADNWADYRPARPVDFVGREYLQREIFNHFDLVRRGNTRTRLFAIKGPSGWGKKLFGSESGSPRRKSEKQEQNICCGG